nr:protein artichoke-like [Parasteatoda tepidariorum]
MPALKRLAIRTNGLTRIPEQTFKPIWDQVNIVDLRGNPIICDSQLDWIAKLKSKTAVFGRCDGPEDQRGVELNDFISGR